MKPFSLTAVLRYRKQLENTAATHLAHAQQEMIKKKQELRLLKEQYSTILATLAKNQSTGMDITELQRFENHIEWLSQHLEKATEDLKSASEKVRQKREIVVEKSRDRKALEKLKDKQDREWKRYLDKKENALLDEIAVLSHERKQQDS